MDGRISRRQVDNQFPRDYKIKEKKNEFRQQPRALVLNDPLRLSSCKVSSRH